MTEDHPLDAHTRKGRIRARMWTDALDAHRAGRVRVTEARASDFVGPGLGDGAHMGDRTVARVLTGRPVGVIGDPDVEHSWTSVDDVARTLAVLATDERAWGRPWHVPTAPAVSQRQLVDALARAAGRRPVPVRSVPIALLRLVGIVSPTVRELPEIAYQFTAPFVIDSSAATSTFGLEPTPLADTLATTVAASADPDLRDPAA